MNVISLKDYAKQHNISYEAVRKQVSRFKEELGSHIIQDGRQQLLDEEAVAFLDARREKNPIAIIQQDKDDTINALEAENKDLLQKVALLQDELLNEKNRRLEIADKIAKVELLEERKVAAELALEDARKEFAEELETVKCIADANEQEADRAKAKAEAYEKYAKDLKAYYEVPLLKRIFKKSIFKKPVFDSCVSDTLVGENNETKE